MMKAFKTFLKRKEPKKCSNRELMWLLKVNHFYEGLLETLEIIRLILLIVALVPDIMIIFSKLLLLCDVINEPVYGPELLAAIYFVRNSFMVLAMRSFLVFFVIMIIIPKDEKIEEELNRRKEKGKEEKILYCIKNGDVENLEITEETIYRIGEFESEDLQIYYSSPNIVLKRGKYEYYFDKKNVLKYVTIIEDAV